MPLMEVTRISGTIISTFVGQESRWRKWCDVFILVVGNFVNYADRYTLAGILPDVQNNFNITNEFGGLIQTIYVVVYTLVSPLYGYLGDRYDRTLLIAYSLCLWNAANLGCSFVHHFWAFLLLKGLFGLGQSCFVIVAPTILGDLFIDDERSKVLAIFYLAIPMGSGLGYTIGAEMFNFFGDWRWSLRATPCIAIVVTVLVLAFLRDPFRGSIEGKQYMTAGTWREDLIYLLKNKSYMFCTFAFTAVAFSAGAISWWAPKMIAMAFTLNNRTDVTPSQVGSVYGLLSTFAGFFGLLLGYLLTFKSKTCCPQIDPIVCAVGCLLSAPLLIGSCYVAEIDTIGSWTLFFVGGVALNLNWAIICDIILKVVVPIKRSSSVGLQLFIGHSLGDAGSPYLLGLLADKLYDNYQKSVDDHHLNEFKGLRISYFIACGVAALGGMFFILTAVYINRDANRAKRGSV